MIILWLPFHEVLRRKLRFLAFEELSQIKVIGAPITKRIDF